MKNEPKLFSVSTHDVMVRVPGRFSCWLKTSERDLQTNGEAINSRTGFIFFIDDSYLNKIWEFFVEMIYLLIFNCNFYAVAELPTQYAGTVSISSCHIPRS